MLRKLASLIALLTPPAWAQLPFVSSCAEDSHIDEAKRKALNSAAINFAEAFLGPDPSSGFAALSKEGQRTITEEQLTAQARAIQEQLQPTDLRAQHVYMLNISGRSTGRVICATDLKKADGWESLETINVPEQAYVLMSAQARNNGL